MANYEMVPESLDEWIECVKLNFVGKPAPETPLWNNVATAKAAFWFAWACGDLNPLFTDVSYSPEKYNGHIVPPTYPISIKWPTTPEIDCHSGILMTDYDGGVDIVNNDLIRLGDRFRAEKIVTTVEKKEHQILGATAVVTAKTIIWNQTDEIVATMKGWSFHSPKPGEGKMLYDRSIYKYSEEEKKKIGNDIETYPPRRGAKPLYWEDVEIGDKLPQKVKGPLEMISIENFKHAIFGIPATYDLSYKEAVTNKYRRPSIHPLTGWPETPMNEHLDWVLCKNKGMPLPYEPGLGRSAMAYHILTDWMGDDGFVRRLETDIISPFFYGDIQWITGEVIRKEKRKEGAAVDIGLKMTNQLGQITMSGTATILLPSTIDGAVRLPIPNTQ